MRALTVTDRVLPGINFIQDSDGDYVVRCGDNGIPLTSKDLVEQYAAMEKDLKARASGVIGYLQSIDRRAPTGHIISEGWVSPGQARWISESVGNVGWPIHELEGDENGLFVPDRPERRGEALVHVLPFSSNPGSIRFWRDDPRNKTVKDEKNGHLKVTKIYEPFPGEGCTALCTGYGKEGAPEMLVRMVRGASFRISRDVAYDSDEPAELVVVWTGGQLKLFPSKRRVHVEAS